MLLAAPSNLATARITGDALPVLEDADIDARALRFGVAIADDGTLLYERAVPDARLRGLSLWQDAYRRRPPFRPVSTSASACPPPATGSP